MSRRKLREACGSAVGPSNMKLYCSLAKWQFPKVCGQASQSFLERQVVGLAPYPPQTGPTRACQCGAQLGTEHIVFECPDVVVPRQMLLVSLDMIAATYTPPRRSGHSSRIATSWRLLSDQAGRYSSWQLKHALSTTKVWQCGRSFMRMLRTPWHLRATSSGRKLRPLAAKQLGRKRQELF
jgi:hypothetical protein